MGNSLHEDDNEETISILVEHNGGLGKKENINYHISSKIEKKIIFRVNEVQKFKPTDQQVICTNIFDTDKCIWYISAHSFPFVALHMHLFKC